MISIQQILLFASRYLILFLALNHQAIIIVEAQSDQAAQSGAYLVSNGLEDPILYTVDTSSSILNENQLDQQQHHNSPGHYEFEVAPKLEPPSVRKPPYSQSQQHCAGSDILSSYSPRDTLCGDLNQGRLPLNPLGQSIGDQSYPFELIKNKTLQFLARALPILKYEYDSIPKVARYMPANQLLNPTHQASTLSHEQLNQINQHFADASYLSALYSGGQADEESDQFTSGYLMPPFMSKRRKRSVRSIREGSVSAVDINSKISGITVAELQPNATLVVSSAHSSHPNGRILQFQTRPTHHYHSNLADVGPTLVARETIKVSQAGRGQKNSSASHASELVSKSTANQNQGHQVNNGKSGQIVRVQEVQQVQHADTSAAIKVSSTTNGQQQVTSRAASNGIHDSGQLKESSSNGDINTKQNDSSDHNSSEHHATSDSSAKPQQIQARSSAKSGSGGVEDTSSLENSLSSPQTAASESSLKPKQAKGADRRRQSSAAPCADSSNGFSLAICQAASALVDGSKQPAWIQLVKHLGSIYSGATDNSLWSALMSNGGQGEPKNSAGASDLSKSKSSSGHQLSSFLSPFSSLLSASSGPARSDTSSSVSPSKETTSAASGKDQSLSSALGTTMARLALAGWASNVLTSLVEYFVPTVFQSVGRSGFAKRKKMNDPREQFVDTPASMAASLKLSQQPGVMPNKQPPTPCPSVEEYISPTFARNYLGAWKYVVQIPHEGYFTQTIQRTSCLKQKCEFTDGICHEAPRWVSLLVAEIYYPNAIFGRSGHPTASATGATPSTGEPPMQSGISNSQSPGSQMSSSQQKSIHLPASQANNIMQQRQMALAAGQQPVLNRPKTVQDPLQMIDSLNTYDHNLNAAYMNAANELAATWSDPAALQMAYNNYQLQQRNGLGPSKQQPFQYQNPTYLTEARTTSRSDQGVSPAPTLGRNMNLNTQTANLLGSQDYIIALAAAALQQNPNMNINELIQSLQLPLSVQQQLKRKRRDLTASDYQRLNADSQYLSQANHANGNNNPFLGSRPALTQRSGQSESVPSMNDLNSAPQSHVPNNGQIPQSQVSSSGLNQNQALSLDQMTRAPSVSMQSSLLGHQIDPSGQQQAQASHQAPSNEPLNGQQQQSSAQQTQQSSSQQQSQSQSNQQIDCDGHDKIGCYVVRVYYDWFLVNGSCKCWKTNLNGQTGGSASSANSFIRRIFTG